MYYCTAESISNLEFDILSISYNIQTYMNKTELAGKKLPELRIIAKSIGIKRVEKYKKAELVDIIVAGGVKDATPAVNNDTSIASPETESKDDPNTDNKPIRRRRKTNLAKEEKAEEKNLFTSNDESSKEGASKGTKQKAQFIKVSDDVKSAKGANIREKRSRNKYNQMHF